MFNISSTAKRLLMGMAAICAASFVVFIFLDISILAVLLGLLLGFSVSAVKIIILEKSINKALDMDSKQATLYMRLNYILRYFITGGVLLAAILSDFINFPAAVVGVLAMPFSAYFVRLVTKEV